LILRWIYNIWNFLLKTVGYLLLFIVIFAGLFLAAIQLPQSKDYIKGQVEEAFNEQFTGTIDIESIQGFIPFRTQFNDVRLTPPDGGESPLSADAVYASVNLWELIQGNINVTALDIRSPGIILSQDDTGITLAKIFENRSESERSDRDGSDRLFKQFTIYAPEISISNGRFEADESIIFPAESGIQSPLIVTNLNASFFLESDEDQQFLDITSLTANSNDSHFQNIELSGQFFNDGHYLELNGLTLRSDHANIELYAEASPIRLFDENLGGQLASAVYQLDIQQFYVEPELLARIDERLSRISNPVALEGVAEGNLESFWIDNFQLSSGDFYVLADGRIENITGQNLSYDLKINNLVAADDALFTVIPNLEEEQYDLSRYGTATLRGTVSGTLEELNSELNLNTDLGSAFLGGRLTFDEFNSYDLRMEFDSLDVSPILRDSVGSTILYGMISANGAGFDRTGNVESSIDLSDSRIKNHNIQKLVSEIGLINEAGTYSIDMEYDMSELAATGNFSLSDQQQFSFEADILKFDITQFTDRTPYESTLFSGRLSGNIEGSSPEDLFGRVSVEISESIINEDTLRPHQLYVDIDEPVGDQRNLRMTSSFFNSNVTGTIYPEKLASAARYWYDYLSERINEELFFEKEVDDLLQITPGPALLADSPVDLTIQFTSRDLKLLRHYIPELPEIESSANLNLNLNATKESLSLNGSFFDDSLTVNDSYFDDLGISFTGIFTHGALLKESSLMDVQINSPLMNLMNRYEVKGGSFNLSLRDSIITTRQQIDHALENLFFLSETRSVWEQDQIKTEIDTLSLGSAIYSWHGIGTPTFTFGRDGSLTFDRFIVESSEDFFEIDGRFSESPEDSVNYNIRNFSLGRVSELIGGRIQFEGIVDGDFTTRSLTQIPSIQGDLNVTDGKINGRVIGDVSLRSRFNPDENQFDTDIHIYTDPDRYADYLEQNDDIGMDLFLSGFFRAPDDDDDTEDLFYFDADLREIDMWIVTFIIPNIIEEMEGSSSGTGFIRGSRDDFNYEAVFDIADVYGRPTFTNVPYTLGGKLIFNRADGLLFEGIEMDDRLGGRGMLSGQIDLDDFSPQTYFDLRLNMNDMRFMNNVQDPNVPFYADLYGTGTAYMDGTGDSPTIRSTSAIQLSSNSRISIPLRPETELEQDRRFIQFVDSFDSLIPIQARDRGNGSTRGNGDEEIDLTFLELFSMNLQFVANDPVRVQLIFDPVTNDILNATGTGQITLNLSDQDLSMFGRFNISGGEYQFVGGDIFTRRFNIQEGGYISWSGDLADASLNVTAAYRARPDISTLLPAGTTFQRIPIELILQIGGTISEIENDFFFQVPSGIDGTQDPTITAQINRLNQNEDEKILQAFGLLLTGNFVPSDELQNPEFGNVTGTSALVNPLVSSQIISPLLSNQINSLLRSDITFDVDFNLNAFNEVDLGVALRLFDDRIVLRREGQITGDTEIGDLGATYKINRIFSVTAFHRQDPTLSNRAETDARQTQEMNGMGVEAQFQFNTWQSLRNRVSNSFRRLFGLKEKEPDVGEERSDPVAEN